MKMTREAAEKYAHERFLKESGELALDGLRQERLASVVKGIEVVIGDKGAKINGILWAKEGSKYVGAYYPHSAHIDLQRKAGSLSNNI